MNQRILLVILVVVTVLVAIVYGGRLFSERPESPQALAQIVLSNSDPQTKQVAAVKLATLAAPPLSETETPTIEKPAIDNEARREVVRVYKESTDRGCRAAMIESLAHGYDYESMPLILDALENLDPLVSGRANAAVARMLNVKIELRAGETAQERKRKVDPVRARWADLEKSGDKLAQWKKRQKEIEAQEKKRRG